MIKKTVLFILITSVVIAIFVYLGFRFNILGNIYNAEIIHTNKESTQSEKQPNSELESLIENEVKKLQEGRILYNIPEKMKVGRAERVVVRIEKAATDAFEKNLEGSGNYEIDDIKVAPLMKVRLFGDGKMQILEVSDPEQIVIGDYYSQWVWEVTPLKSGHTSISLVVSFKINIPDQVDRYQDYVLFDKQINVEINPLFSIRSFIENYWQWLVVTILVPAVTFIYKKYFKSAKTKRKKNKKVK